MRGEGGTVRLVHLVGVAVVGGQQHRAAHRERLLDDLARTLVHRFHRLDRRVEYAGVADHVAVGKVEDDHVIFAAVQPGEQLVGDQVGAHLRLQVVGRNLRGVDQRAVLARGYRLHAAVEEEGDVRVLLGLGDAQLLQALLGDVFAKGVVEALRLEGNLYVRHGRVVLGHADVVQREEGALETGKVRVNQRAGDLAGAVWTEVVEDDRIICGNPSLRRVADDNRHDEFVGDFGCVGVLDRLCSISALLALA